MFAMTLYLASGNKTDPQYSVQKLIDYKPMFELSVNQFVQVYGEKSSRQKFVMDVTHIRLVDAEDVKSAINAKVNRTPHCHIGCACESA
jgi:hypothetical protein